MTRSIIFVLDLLQDVNILRPLFGLAAEQAGAQVTVLISQTFIKRDAAGLWQGELRAACDRFGFPIHAFATEFEAFGHLQGKRGVMIAAAESSVSGHVVIHNLYLAAPPGFIRATIQHGFECVGFLHNGAHDRAHGRDVTFNADVICGWFGEDILYSVSAQEKSKLLVTGPPLLLPRWDVPGDAAAPDERRPSCLVCENLHSVRLRGDVLKSDFVAQFAEFAGDAEAKGLDVWLRPHPAGRFTDMKGSALSVAVQKSVAPIYKEDLGRFAFAVSAPSSILFDLIAAGVPVAVWQDSAGEIDCRNYAGLPIISRIGEWWEFAAQVRDDRAGLVARQGEFLRRLQIPENISARYADVLSLSG